MNAKKCKQLRRKAEMETIGAPARFYAVDKRGVAAVQRADTTRAHYQALKRAAEKL